LSLLLEAKIGVYYKENVELAEPHIYARHTINEPNSKFVQYSV
jgi:hypothetical protein